MSANPTPHTVICSWCDSTIRPGSPTLPVSHGLCLPCLQTEFGYPVENLSTMSQHSFDCLPFGVIQLDRDGLILSYNAAEAKLAHLIAANVIGKHFFRDIAPCTRVKEFEGRWLKMLDSPIPTREKFNYLFKFSHGTAFVQVALTFDPSQIKTSILIRQLDKG